MMKNFFLTSEQNFHPLYLSSRHCAPTWGKHFHHLCNCVLGFGRLWLDALWAAFRLNKQGTLNLSLFSKLLISFGGPLLVLLQFFNVFLELEGPKLDTVFQVWPNKCQVGWNNHIPWSAGCTLNWCSPERSLLSLQQGHTADSCLADSPQGFSCSFQ